jgi:adenylate cyclase
VFPGPSCILPDYEVGSNLLSLIAELRRRNVLRAAAGYIVGAWLIIQVVETTFPAFGFDDLAVRWVIIALAIGFLPALVLAWVFEWTPGGLKRDREVDHGDEDLLSRVKRFDRIVMIGLAIGMAYFAVDKFLLDPARDAERERQVRQEARSEALVESYGERSIAVLPFDDLSPNRDQAYFGEGIAEELLNLLAHVNDLRVAGRTSSFTVAGRDLTIPEMAEALNVGHILEGSVRKAGGQLRITVQLIEARSDTHLWSQTFDREYADIFAIQDEIAAEVVDRLQITLLEGVPLMRKADPEAYALYLQARQLFHNQSQPGDFERSGELYRRAMEIDPEFIDAIAGYRRYLSMSGETLPGETDNRARIQRMLLKMLEIDPNHPEVLYALSFQAMDEDNDLETAARYLERAFESDPRHYDLLWYSALMLPGFGRSDLAAQVGEYLLARDPLSALCRDSTARAYRNIGDFDRAIELLREGLVLQPEWPPNHWGLTLTLVYAGRPQEALQNAIELEQKQEGPFPGHLEALHDLGMLEEFEAWLPEYIEVHADCCPAYVGQVYAWIGDADRALEWLEKEVATDSGSWGIRIRIVRRAFQKLKDDPRMQTLLERYQLTPEQVEEVGLNLRLPSPGR